jgi:hypothetical protein
VAKRLNGSVDSYTHADSTVLRPTFPISWGLWFRASSNPGNFKYMMSKVAVAGSHATFAISTNGSGEIRAMIGWGTNPNEFTTTTGVSTAFSYDGNWHHYAGIYDGIGVDFRFDGSSIAFANDTRALAYTSQSFFVGSFDGTQLYAAGDYADVTVWNTALTTNDLTSIFSGVASSLIRPDKVVMNWPMLGPGDEPDYFGNQTLTVTGAPTVVDHPKTYGYPGRGANKLATAGAPPSFDASRMMPFFI